MDTETRFRLVTQNLQEIITPAEVRTLLETNDHPRGYVGFEPSGMMHAGTGLIVGKKMKDYVDAGFHFIIYLAEWHGWINNKLGGDLDNIRAGAEYFKDCFTALGLPAGKVEYLWASRHRQPQGLLGEGRPRHEGDDDEEGAQGDAHHGAQRRRRGRRVELGTLPRPPDQRTSSR